MRITASALLLLVTLFASLGAVAAPEDGPLGPKDVTHVRVGNYGAPSTTVDAKGDLVPLLAELSTMRSRQWKQVDTRLTCYSTLTLMNGPKTVAIFRVGPETLVERPVAKTDLAYSLPITADDLPLTRKHIAEAAPAICR